MFENLLSNNTYVLQVTYTYDLSDGDGARELVKDYNVKTRSKALPIPEVRSTVKNHTTLGFIVNFRDNDGVIISRKTEFIHGEDVTLLENLNQYTFSNLLSNNDYTLRVTYTYDLNDGSGEREDIREVTVRTNAKEIPQIVISNLVVGADSVFASIQRQDRNYTIIDYKVELYQAEVFVEENVARRGEFKSLQHDTEYTILITYSYDLNDGKEICIDTVSKTFRTEFGVEVVDCEIANTSGVSEGETIYVELKLDNPNSVPVASVVINGKSNDD
jgi:hypothetical protein